MVDEKHLDFEHLKNENMQAHVAIIYQLQVAMFIVCISNYCSKFSYD